MTPQEQSKFVTALLNAHAARIIRQIEAGQIPANWDGIELRRHIRDVAEDSCIGTFEGKRKRDYKNIKLVNNL